MPGEESTSSIFTLPFAISVIALLGVLALFFYIFRSNSTLLEKINEHEKHLAQQNASMNQLNANIRSLSERVMLLEDFLNKKIKKKVKMFNQMNERFSQIDSLQEQLEEISYSLPTTKKKKKPVEKPVEKNKKKVKVKDTSDESESESDESESSESESEKKKKKKTTVADLI